MLFAFLTIYICIEGYICTNILTRPNVNFRAVTDSIFCLSSVSMVSDCVCACVRVCMHAYIRACVHVCVYDYYMCACMHVCVCACMRVCVHACIPACVRAFQCFIFSIRNLYFKYVTCIHRA